MNEVTRGRRRAVPRRVALLSFLVLAHFIGAVLHGAVPLAAVGAVPSAHAADAVVGSVAPRPVADGGSSACPVDDGTSSACPGDEGANTDQRAGTTQVLLLLGLGLGAVALIAVLRPPARSAAWRLRRVRAVPRLRVPLRLSLCIQRV